VDRNGKAFGADLATAKRGVERVPGALAEDCTEHDESSLKRQSATRLATPAVDASAPNAVPFRSTIFG
jgi:IS5 family transposase